MESSLQEHDAASPRSRHCDERHASVAVAGKEKGPERSRAFFVSVTRSLQRRASYQTRKRRCSTLNYCMFLALSR
ncbi:hypothetical protein FKV68_07120 [Sinorhizobium mexicanum]|uniref:Uncharacterized protein n=1 Tax=Sinorhizobium mexicanum TaxID=375549 RepID=A0A859QVD7_9HYPH|nr:hypothetical protein FKV68_07120 [Sinorhizobium mexicanum]